MADIHNVFISHYSGDVQRLRDLKDRLKNAGCKVRNSSAEEDTDGLQRMLNAIEPGSILPIHRHQKTSETVVCIRGRLVEEFYDDLERICTERIELSPNGPVVALNIPAGKWHTVQALESGTVILEMKEGAYEPTGPEDILVL